MQPSHREVPLAILSLSFWVDALAVERHHGRNRVRDRTALAGRVRGGRAGPRVVATREPKGSAPVLTPRQIANPSHADPLSREHAYCERIALIGSTRAARLAGQ